ncbi:MAG TPA: L-histidine N(alpha)-methyltransferase [Acetobacteraceae bacterium]|nr:L-histidine N(alpha)-methyltransferase [Acetobacteraceae bacterium]
MPDDHAVLGRVSNPELLQAALDGLTACPKTLPPKFFYDEEGCRLFGLITQLPEYYPTRTEMKLLAQIGPEVASLMPQGAVLVEYGASDEAKALFLLNSGRFSRYVPIDVAVTSLRALRARLAASHPALDVQIRPGDFLSAVDIPRRAPILGFFPGSTIGNLDRPVAQHFLADARVALGTNGRFLIGVDLAKSPDILIPAYDDAQAVTAAFNLNLLVRMNREIGTRFNPDNFSHRAIWNGEKSRIEMHLVSRYTHIEYISGEMVSFAPGETIHTENSHKYTQSEFISLAAAAGWSTERVWVDENNLFAVYLLA